MAFWRALAMDSWNPLSRSFWTKGNLLGTSELEEKRRQFKQYYDDNVPDVLKDSVTTELPKNPVFSPYGHCFDITTLEQHWQRQLSFNHEKTCPLTGRPLNSSLLLNTRQASNLIEIFNKIHKNRAILWKAIDDMEPENVTKIRLQIKKSIEQLNEYARAFENQFILISGIDRIKERLKMDKTSSEHLKFWHAERVSAIAKKLSVKTEKTFLKFTETTKIKDAKNNEYYIPKQIANAMQKANEEYKNQDALINAVNQTLYTNKSYYRSIFCCCLRSKAEKNYLQLKQLKILI